MIDANDEALEEIEVQIAHKDIPISGELIEKLEEEDAATKDIVHRAVTTANTVLKRE